MADKRDISEGRSPYEEATPARADSGRVAEDNDALYCSSKIMGTAKHPVCHTRRLRASTRDGTRGGRMSAKAKGAAH